MFNELLAPGQLHFDRIDDEADLFDRQPVRVGIAAVAKPFSQGMT